jgi:integral membrane protein (TIGR01906 family)
VSEEIHEEPKSPVYQRILRWTTIFLVPLVLILGTIRLMLFPWFLEVEYRTPGFPADTYGFTFAERLYWSKISLAYLTNDAGIESLANLHFPQGQLVPEPSCSFAEDCTAIYNARELRHLVDVKNIIHIAIWALWIGVALLVFIGLLAWRGKWLANYRRAMALGGWLTGALMLGIIVFVLLAFGVIFVWFHEIFFPPGTWTFYYSDTLIRLFPQRFWRDAFLVVAGVPALIGVGLGYFLDRR